MRKDKIDQARANALKVVRTAIRLKHSIEADNELNVVLPKAEQQFDAMVTGGQLPDPLTILDALGVEHAK